MNCRICYSCYSLLFGVQHYPVQRRLQCFAGTQNRVETQQLPCTSEPYTAQQWHRSLCSKHSACMPTVSTRCLDYLCILAGTVSTPMFTWTKPQSLWQRLKMPSSICDMAFMSRKDCVTTASMNVWWARSASLKSCALAMHWESVELCASITSTCTWIQGASIKNKHYLLVWQLSISKSKLTHVAYILDA